MKNNPTTQPSAYLRLADMRTRYRVSGSTIWNWCKTNGLPIPYKLGANTTVWKLADLLQWEASHTSAK
jgi:predicted DNA-binding transcriptional regulator AlpA